ncbi:30S ribosomal protein S5 [Patescibacteria group bacterium]
MKKQFRKGQKHTKQPKEYEEEVIQIDRVTRVVKGGRKLRFRATVAIGNRKGKVGIGIGKSHEVTGAIQKAIAKAKSDVVEIKLNGTTIPHDMKIKYKAAKIIFLPAAPGTGIIAGGPIRKVLDLAGVHDILSKSYGTTNKINNTRATFLALKSMRETPYMKKKKKAAEQAKRASKEAIMKAAAPKKVEAKKRGSTKKN